MSRPDVTLTPNAFRVLLARYLRRPAGARQARPVRLSAALSGLAAACCGLATSPAYYLATLLFNAFPHRRRRDRHGEKVLTTAPVGHCPRPDLTMLLHDAANGAPYLVYVNRTELDLLKEFVGVFARRILEGRIERQAPQIVGGLRARLESGAPSDDPLSPWSTVQEVC